MKMNQQTFENLYKERMKDVETIINIESNDDDDLKQEGLLGVYHALRKDPHGSTRFLMNKAKWGIISSLRKGRSVDNGFYKRKNLKIIHHNQSPCEDGLFAAVIPENGKYPVDEQAIFRIDLERFMEKLTENERQFIRLKVIDGVANNTEIRKKLKIPCKEMAEITWNVRQQIKLAFAE